MGEYQVCAPPLSVYPKSLIRKQCYRKDEAYWLLISERGFVFTFSSNRHGYTAVNKRGRQCNLLAIGLLIYLDVMIKPIWKNILHILVTVLTALATTLGVSSCM